jgi:serine phosphatase RsbU (regulator of sigma subunit)
MSIKQRIYDIIKDDGDKLLANRIFNRGITWLIIANVLMVVLDLLDVFPAGVTVAFYYIEVFSVAVFTLEYAARLWTADLLHPRKKPFKARLTYARSFMAVIDVLAVLPFYLPLVFPINMVILRLLRLLRLARILKLNRYTDTKVSEMVLSSIKESIIIIDAEHSFISANESACELFPGAKGMKKYAPVGSIKNWPAELNGIDDKKSVASIPFSLEENTFYSATVSPVYADDKLLRLIIIIMDVTEAVLHERAEKERIRKELESAASIQASMLPSDFPAFPDRPEFDVYALMNPAKEVGGDFYDFFMIDGDNLAVVIADVSGKGIPAALIMVNAKNQIKSAAQRGHAIQDVLAEVNNILCENNSECMFVTAFLGVLNIPSGRFTFVNAGHDIPLVRKNGRFEWLETSPDLMLGFMEDSEYATGETALEKGDVLFLYTDGVTEAGNPEKEEFTEERLIKAANGRGYIAPKDFLDAMARQIESFAAGAEQFDDITMLALEIK